VDERGCATLIPANLMNKIKQLTSAPRMAEFGLQKKSGGFA